MTKFRNKITIDTRVLTECQKKIDKTRFYKLIKKLNESISADGVHPELMDDHDNYFEPRTEPEKDLWASCRNLAKEDMDNLLKYSEAGKRGAEIRKQKKEEPIRQPAPAQKPVKGAFVPPKDADEVYEYAQVNGMMCSKEQAHDFYDYYSGIGWRIGNEFRTPINDWHPFWRKWLRNPIATKQAMKAIKRPTVLNLTARERQDLINKEKTQALLKQLKAQGN